MTRREPPWVGHVIATAFVIDVGLIGETEARRRILTWWSAGAALREVAGRRWLLTLPRPVDLRCERSPGLPLEPLGGGSLAPAGMHQAPGDGLLRTLEGGTWVDRPIKALPAVELGDWLNADALVVHHLFPVEGPAPVPAVIEPPEPAASVDLRATARLRMRSAKTEALARDLTEDAQARGRGWGRGRAEGGAPRTGSGRLARLVLRSPAAPVVRRSHAKYLRSLTDAFEHKHYDDALRDAIALSEGGLGFTALRLPPPRRSITGPTLARASGGSAIPWGPTVYQHLTTIYRDAANNLEAAGRIAEAAFVQADLLGNVTNAVALLERHGQFMLAADLAEGRELAAEVIVRLRWRAGQHERALAVARARGAYAAAIKRLEPLDSEQARQLRAAWARDLNISRDHVGAVEAAWPDPHLRPLVIDDIRAGMAMGGPSSAHLLAYLLALRTTAEGHDTALTLLRSRDPELTAARDRFLSAFSDLASSDPVADRRIATEALRVMTAQETAPRWDLQSSRRAVNCLSPRADPVLRADLPSSSWNRAVRRDDAVLTADALEEPGQLPVPDAAVLSGGAILVAHGAHGARLLTLDGRTRAQWDVPTHRLVVADHGAAALLATYLGDLTWELHALDLATRQIQRWITIRVNHLPQSYDGTTLTILDEHGSVNFLDVQSPQPKVLWRELNGVGEAVDLARSPGRLVAAVRTFPAPGLPEGRLEIWHWELPSLALRGRTPVVWPRSQARVTSAGVLLYLDQVEEIPEASWTYALTAVERGISREPEAITAVGPVELMASGMAHALALTSPDDMRLDVTTASPGTADMSFRFLGHSRPQLRSHADTVTVWDERGRIVAVDTAQRRLVCNVRTRL